jgi:hypothetical protein
VSSGNRRASGRFLKLTRRRVSVVDDRPPASGVPNEHLCEKVGGTDGGAGADRKESGTDSHVLLPKMWGTIRSLANAVPGYKVRTVRLHGM